MIENLKEKLEGTIPVTREELFILVNSWGRKSNFYNIENIKIEKCEPTKCYDLSNLDVSQIIDLSQIFTQSLYDGDLSKWDVSSCNNMYRMFENSEFNNDSLKNWNVSNIDFMIDMFYGSKFNGDISNWNISNCEYLKRMFANSDFDGDISKWKFNKNVNCDDIFSENKNFENKYNNSEAIPEDTKSFLEWFEKNRINISNANISKEEKLDMENYLDNFNISKNNLVR